MLTYHWWGPTAFIDTISSTGSVQDINLRNEFEKNTFKITVTFPGTSDLTHWGQVTHICVSKLTIVSYNGLSPCRRQAIIWTNAGILLTGPLGTNLRAILIEIYVFRRIHLKMSSGNWRPFCHGLSMLMLPPEEVLVADCDCWKRQLWLIFHLHSDGFGVLIIRIQTLDQQIQEQYNSCGHRDKPQNPATKEK